MSAQDVEPEIPLEPLRRREPRAFEALVRRHQPAVLGLCQSMGLNGPDIDDAAAEAFANVFRALPNFEGRSTLRTWVYRITCRTIPRIRARMRKTKGAELPAEQIDDAQRSPFEESESAELCERLWSEVEKLDVREAMAIELYYRQELPVEDVAASLQCPTGTVKTLLFRARQKLRFRLSPQELVR